ncbi:hypothetical protein GpartN1_g4893.t1 [Galdieria partita]|uniref:Uncharacterized protein n=1 Tax=Galdieria partita TaxID=83374 RepID=A0A9C7US22_9RHOD|nr:hypothetical protein GpartN1_g4893.t1 [Galdieria partita]
MRLLEEYNSTDDNELCKTMVNLNDLLKSDNSIIASDILSQNLEKIICENERHCCTVVNAFKLYLKITNICPRTGISKISGEREEIFKDYWKYVKEQVVIILEQNANLLEPSQVKELIDLKIEAIRCNVDNDGYESLLNCFQTSSISVKRFLLEKIQLLDLEKDTLHDKFVLPLFEKIYVVIEKLIMEQGFDELFLLNLSSDDSSISSEAILQACIGFMIDTLSRTSNPKHLVEGNLALIVNGLTKHLRDSYSGSNESMMNAFAERMAHLIDTIFERLQMENFVHANCSECIQEMIIRVALSPLPLTATELNIRAFLCWLYVLSESNKISKKLLSLQIVDAMTGTSLNIFVAAFDIACNDIDHRVRTVAFRVVVQALLLDDFPVGALASYTAKVPVEDTTYRNDLMDDIISTTVGWPTSADEQAAIFACLALTVALIYKKEFRELITHYCCQPKKELYFDLLLDFIKNVLGRGVPEIIIQHLLYLISVCLTFSDGCRQLLTNRIDSLNAILPLAISENSSLTRGLSYVVISFFLGSGCHDATLSEYETKLRTCKVQLRQDLIFCLDKGYVSSSPMEKFEGLLKGSSLSGCLDVLKEHWSHLFRNALITLETVPLQFSKFSEILSASECSFGNSSLTKTISNNIEDFDFADVKVPESSLLLPFPENDSDISVTKTHSATMESSNEDYFLNFTNGVEKAYSEKQRGFFISEKADFLLDYDSIIAEVEETDTGSYERHGNFSLNLQRQNENMDWSDKLNKLCARLESVACRIEGATLGSKEEAKVGKLRQTRKCRATQLQKKSFEIFTLEDGDMKNCKVDVICQVDHLKTEIFHQGNQECPLPNVQSYRATEYLNKCSCQNIRKVVHNLRDYFERWLVEMEHWQESSTEKLRNYFLQTSALESNIGKVKEYLAMSQFHEDEWVSSSDKEKTQSLHDTHTILTASSDSDFLEERKKFHDQRQLMRSLVVRLKTLVYSDFNKWCNYLLDEVSSRLAENSEILDHLQMQMYNIKRSCDEKTQLDTLLTLLFRKKNKRGDFSSTTRVEDDDFILKGDELSFLMDQLSGQRPLIALISLCIFLRDYLNVTQRDLRESNAYLATLQRERKPVRSREYIDFAEARIRELMLQKDKLYSLLDKICRRWQECFVHEFSEDDFHLLQLAADEASIPANNGGIMKAPQSDGENAQFEKVFFESNGFYTQRKHEKLLIHALKVNNLRIEKFAKISLENRVSRHKFTADEPVTSKDYKRLQKEHKILLSVLANLHREYCNIANQSLQSYEQNERE